MSAIREIREVSRDSVIAFLERHGLTHQVIVWKYFDDGFRPDAARGLVAMRDAEVVGFIGLIPFDCASSGSVSSTAWTCDWFVDSSKASGATGLALLKAAVKSVGSVHHVGGNEITVKLFGRLADYFDPAAVREYSLTLSIGSIVKRAKSRIPALGWVPSRPFERLPASPSVLRGPHQSRRVTPGSSLPFVSSLAGAHFDTGFHPQYDTEYVGWQIDRRPGLVSYTVETSGCTALLWHRESAPADWRVVLVPAEGARDIGQGINDVAHFAFREGADVLRTWISSQDHLLRDALMRSRFKESKQVPFFSFYASGNTGPSEPMSGLSYLDADNAGLF